MSTETPPPLTARLSSSIKSTAYTLTSPFQPAENELARWRRTFERFAKEEKDGKKFVALPLSFTLPGPSSSPLGTRARALDERIGSLDERIGS